MRYAHSLTAVNRKLKTGYAFDGAAGEAPSPAAVRRLVHTMFWIGWTAGSLATMALCVLFWLIWG